MIRAPRIPHPRRPILLAVVITALLAFPMGIVLASHQFSDVPTSNPFHADIDALVDAGVTAGCGGGKYCPTKNVTRDQMAAFMNRLGALGPGKTPVVNAAKLGGIASTGFHRFGANAPSSSLQTGVFTLGVEATAAGDLGFGAISYPNPIGPDLTRHVVPAGGPNPAGCSGSVSAPNASAGHLCVFLGFTQNMTSVGLFNAYTGFGGHSREGTAMNITAAAAGTTVATGTWAARTALTLTLSPPEPADGPSIAGD